MKSSLSMKNLQNRMNSLCMPAFFYFIISVFSMIIMMVQNIVEGRNVLCLGEYKCTSSSAPLVFGAEAVYILIWTKILDMLCKQGLGSISWILVFFPYILMFILIGIFMLNSGTAQHVPSNVMGFSLSNGMLTGKML